MRRVFAGLAMLALGVSSVLAGPISDISLFSSGVNASGVALLSGNDPHYLYNGALVPVVPTSGIPGGAFPWLLVNTTSAWIAPLANVAAMTTTADTLYTYTTTFNLTGYNLASVIITGQWAADNFGEMYLNATSNAAVDTIVMQHPESYSTWHAFTINSGSAGLIAGPNTLLFQTTNWHAGVGSLTSNPGGVRVEFASTFTGTLDSEIPEPGTLALLGGGLLALGFFRRRR